jgi:ABC-2 type transport system ATP-binding protein
MIKINRISKKFDSFYALQDLSLQVNKGEFYSLLGPNGAGKTTCINMISNITKPSSGSITIAGFDSLTDSYKIKNIIGVVPQEIALYEDLTAIENLNFWGKINQVVSSKLSGKIIETLKFLDLYDQRNQKISTYSGGMKRRINIAAALLHDPEIIFMDEPTVGIDPQSRLFTYEIFQKLHQQGKTIFYTSHNMDEVERLSDRIGIIDHGKLIAEGQLKDLKDQMGMDETLVLRLSKTEDASVVNTQLKISLPFQIFENEVFINSKNTQNDLVHILQQFQNIKVGIQSIEIKKVNLEMIFLKLTGHKLRE